MRVHTPADSVLVKSLALGTLTTGNSASIDTRGYTAAMIVFHITTAGGATYDANAADSPDNSTFTAVTGAAPAQVPASQTRVVATVTLNLKKRQRYLRVAHTVTGTVTGSVEVCLFNPEKAAVTQDVTPVSVL